MRILQDRINTWRSQIPPAPYCRVANAMNFIRGKKHRISPVGEGRVLLAGDGESEIFFCRWRRGNQFKRGVMMHVDRLAREYHLDQIDIVPGGVFIDCGANIGELGIWARGQELDYIAFEPEGLEAYCYDLNNFVGGATRTRIQAVALDGAVNLSDTSGTVILKIEAEGAEPEVLEGAASTLTSVNWVAIDCGHERGVSKAHTFVETNVFMQDLGFHLYRAQFHRITALYRNTRR